MDLFEARVKVSLEEAVRIAELTNIDSCDGEEASINFGQWLRIYHATQLGSELEKKALAKMIRLADRDSTKEDRNRRIVKRQEIFYIVPAGSCDEELAVQKLIAELKRLKRELKREKSSEI